MWNFPDLRGLVVFAFIGIAAVALLLLVGLPLLIWWLWSHLVWVA